MVAASLLAASSEFPDEAHAPMALDLLRLPIQAP